MLTMFIFSATCALVAFVIVCLLFPAGEALDFVQSYFVNKIDLKKMWQVKLGKMFFQCEKCLAGQFALWGFPLWKLDWIGAYYSGGHLQLPVFWFNDYSGGVHFMTVILSIFFAYCLNRIFF